MTDWTSDRLYALEAEVERLNSTLQIVLADDKAKTKTLQEMQPQLAKLTKHRLATHAHVMAVAEGLAEGVRDAIKRKVGESETKVLSEVRLLASQLNAGMESVKNIARAGVNAAADELQAGARHWGSGLQTIVGTTDKALLSPLERGLLK